MPLSERVQRELQIQMSHLTVVRTRVNQLIDMRMAALAKVLEPFELNPGRLLDEVEQAVSSEVEPKD